jgi:hypothetical protein
MIHIAATDIMYRFMLPLLECIRAAQSPAHYDDRHPIIRSLPTVPARVRDTMRKTLASPALRQLIESPMFSSYSDPGQKVQGAVFTIE